MTLADFLLARIAEDEAAARCVPTEETYSVESADPDAKPWRVAEHFQRHGPARVLAECAAKRQIVEQAQDPGDDLFVQILAAIYADHPDYREEWRL